MRRLAERAKACGADMVIGVGGGKALDTAKGCADMLGLPIITVPTIASTCAAVTAISVVYDDSGVFLESMFHQSPPNYTVIDTGILANAPECYLRESAMRWPSTLNVRLLPVDGRSTIRAAWPWR